MPALREQLARHLGYVYRKTHGWQDPEVHWGRPGKTKEVDGYPGQLYTCTPQDLTLAPEDFKP